MSDARLLDKIAGLPETGPLAEAVSFRERLMALTEDSHNAALKPTDPGGLSHAFRAAIACRIARISGDEALAEHYATLAGNSAEAAYCDPAAVPDSAWERAAIAHADKITRRPKDATPEDIEALREAGIAEGDIVRLTGLVAFVNYQLRLALVMRKLAEAQ